MRDPPYDRQFALAAQVGAMRLHYLDVACGCGARRVLGLGVMAQDQRLRDMTLASVAMRVRCQGCCTGPDEVHLTATVFGLQSAEGLGGGDHVWSLLLYQRRPVGTGNYQRRQPSDPLGG